MAITVIGGRRERTGHHGARETGMRVERGGNAMGVTIIFLWEEGDGSLRFDFKDTGALSGM